MEKGYTWRVHSSDGTYIGDVWRQNQDIWQNPNGTWCHHKDSKREWRDRDACETDLRFCLEWERGYGGLKIKRESVSN